MVICCSGYFCEASFSGPLSCAVPSENQLILLEKVGKLIHEVWDFSRKKVICTAQKARVSTW
jgi:hypothetical protein